MSKLAHIDFLLDCIIPSVTVNQSTQTQLLVQSTALVQGKYADSDFYPRLLADAA